VQEEVHVLCRPGRDLLMVLIGLSTAAAFTQSASMRQIIAEQ
jgi:hypothetical protein